MSASSNKVLLVERRVLCVLCSGACATNERLSALLELRSVSWTEPEHRIVFEALAKIPASEILSPRDLLPAQATRMGFPDVNWDSYFTSEITGSGEIRAAVRELKALAGQNE